MSRLQAVKRANELAKKNDQVYFVYMDRSDYTDQWEYLAINERDYYAGTPMVSENNVIYCTAEGYYA